MGLLRSYFIKLVSGFHMTFWWLTRTIFLKLQIFFFLNFHLHFNWQSRNFFMNAEAQADLPNPHHPSTDQPGKPLLQVHSYSLNNVGLNRSDLTAIQKHICKQNSLVRLWIFLCNQPSTLITLTACFSKGFCFNSQFHRLFLLFGQWGSRR